MNMDPLLARYLRRSMAAGVSALAIVLAFVALSVLGSERAGGKHVGWDDVTHGTFFFVFFGWPIAMLITLIGAALWKCVTGQDPETAPILRIAICAAAAGAVFISAVWALFWWQAGDLALVALLGSGAGLVGGVAFRLIAHLSTAMVGSTAGAKPR